MKKNNSQIKGFTLIELIVVIAIIAILSAIVTTNFGSAKAKSRDGKRIADLAHLQLALEQYYGREQYYTEDQEDLVNGGYISSIPKDPVSKTYYGYATNGYDYVLKTTLENAGSAGGEGLPTGTYLGISCNTSARDYCVGPK